MSPNPRKSGVMALGRKPQDLPTDIIGYPLVEEYKHLGGYLNSNFNSERHLKTIASKIIYITNRLTPLRLKKNVKLNVNLYRILIIPLYRLGFAIFSTCTDREK